MSERTDKVSGILKEIEEQEARDYGQQANGLKNYNFLNEQLNRTQSNGMSKLDEIKSIVLEMTEAEKEDYIKQLWEATKNDPQEPFIRSSLNSLQIILTQDNYLNMVGNKVFNDFTADFVSQGIKEGSNNGTFGFATKAIKNGADPFMVLDTMIKTTAEISKEGFPYYGPEKLLGRSGNSVYATLGNAIMKTIYYGGIEDKNGKLIDKLEKTAEKEGLPITIKDAIASALEQNRTRYREYLTVEQEQTVVSHMGIDNLNREVQIAMGRQIETMGLRIEDVIKDDGSRAINQIGEAVLKDGNRPDLIFKGLLQTAPEHAQNNAEVSQALAFLYSEFVQEGYAEVTPELKEAFAKNGIDFDATRISKEFVQAKDEYQQERAAEAKAREDLTDILYGKNGETPSQALNKFLEEYPKTVGYSLRNAKDGIEKQFHKMNNDQKKDYTDKVLSYYEKLIEQKTYIFGSDLTLLPDEARANINIERLQNVANDIIEKKSVSYHETDIMDKLVELGVPAKQLEQSMLNRFIENNHYAMVRESNPIIYLMNKYPDATAFSELNKEWEKKDSPMSLEETFGYVIAEKLIGGYDDTYRQDLNALKANGMPDKINEYADRALGEMAVRHDRLYVTLSEDFISEHGINPNYMLEAAIDKIEQLDPYSLQSIESFYQRLLDQDITEPSQEIVDKLQQYDPSFSPENTGKDEIGIVDDN